MARLSYSKGALVYDPPTMALVTSINGHVNRNVKYKTDMEIYKKKDFWTTLEAGGFGDCDDYAMTKRALLMKEGVLPSCLKLATCWVEPPTKEYHAVLLLVTNKGDMLLDNRISNVSLWSRPNYTWHTVQEGKSWKAYKPISD